MASSSPHGKKTPQKNPNLSGKGLKKNKGLFALLWLLLVGASCGVLVFFFVYQSHGLIETNVLKAINGNKVSVEHSGVEQAPLEQALIEKAVQSQNKKTVFAVYAPSANKAAQAAFWIYQRLSNSPLFGGVTGYLSPLEQKQTGALLFKNRLGLLTGKQRLLLKNGQGMKLYQQALGKIYSPAFPASGNLIERDPFLLFMPYLASLETPQTGTLVQGMTVMKGPKGGFVSLVGAQFKNSTFNLKQQDAFRAILKVWESDFHKTFKDVRLLKTGTLFFASRGSRQARFEMSLFSGLSAGLILILILIVFRSFRPLIYGVLVLSTSCLLGVTIGFAVFGHLHALALVFSITIIGLSVDYSFHYTVFEINDARGSSARGSSARGSSARGSSARGSSARGSSAHGSSHSIIAPLTSGFLTTMAGYLFFLLAPLPLLKQTAVVTGAGLLGSYLTVLWLLPWISQQFPLKKMRASTAQKPSWILKVLLHCPSKVKYGLVVLCLLVGGVGGAYLHADDSPRALQQLDPGLLGDMHFIQSIFTHKEKPEPTTTLLVTGRTLEQVLQEAQELKKQLKSFKGVTLLGDVTALLPSLKRQQANRTLVEKALYRPYLKKFSQQLGATLKEPAWQGGLVYKNLQGNLRKAVDGLIVKAPKGTGVLFVLMGKQGLALGQSLQAQNPNIVVLDIAHKTQKALAQIRKTFQWMILGAIVLMAGCLWWRYCARDMRRIMTPVFLALVGVFGGVGLLGAPVTLFHILAGILILAVGVDFSIFLETSSKANKGTLLAIGLSALTTMISFFMLGFSHTYAVASLGLVVGFGILLCLLFTFLLGIERYNNRQ